MQKIWSKSVISALWSAESNLQRHIEGSHRAQYFQSRSQRNIVQQCTRFGYIPNVRYTGFVSSYISRYIVSQMCNQWGKNQCQARKQSFQFYICSLWSPCFFLDLIWPCTCVPSVTQDHFYSINAARDHAIPTYTILPYHTECDATQNVFGTSSGTFFSSNYFC